MKIPKRHLWAYEVAAMAGDSRASEALRVHRASRTRSLAKSAPRRKAEKVTKDERRARTTEVRAIVFARANGKCECCGILTPSELHHVLGGPDRMAKEHPRTCAALCFPCHHAIHQSNLQRMQELLGWAARNDFTTARSALQRRIDRLRTP